MSSRKLYSADCFCNHLLTAYPVKIDGWSGASDDGTGAVMIALGCLYLFMSLLIIYFIKVCSIVRFRFLHYINQFTFDFSDKCIMRGIRIHFFLKSSRKKALQNQRKESSLLYFLSSSTSCGSMFLLICKCSCIAMQIDYKCAKLYLTAY